ncbi:hypothetical protein BH09ACT7_BH09ACT7_37560 [soil metagenome]
MSKDERPAWQRAGIDPKDPYHWYNIVGNDAAADFCKERGAPVTQSTIRHAAGSRLAYALIAGRRCFSAADLDAWLMSQRRSADDPAVSA